VRADARGFLLKDVTFERLADAIRVVAAGESLIRPGLTERALRALERIPRDFDSLDRPDPLTPRETEVLRLIADGFSNREIADTLGTSEGTDPLQARRARPHARRPRSSATSAERRRPRVSAVAPRPHGRHRAIHAARQAAVAAPGRVRRPRRRSRGSMSSVETVLFPPPVLAFGGFELHRDGRVVDHSGQAVALSPSQHAVLAALVRGGGRVIDRADLVACGWPGGRASYASLARCVCTLRQRLWAAGSDEGVVETVYRRGYRLAVPVARRSVEARRGGPVGRALLPESLRTGGAHAGRRE
jgi:DNA-binding winged helix-turn-helix (wHTH) protein